MQIGIEKGSGLQRNAMWSKLGLAQAVEDTAFDIPQRNLAAFSTLHDFGKISLGLAVSDALQPQPVEKALARSQSFQNGMAANEQFAHEGSSMRQFVPSGESSR